VVVLHLSTKFCANSLYLIKNGDISILRNPPSWICWGKSWDNRRPIDCGWYLYKFCQDRLASVL